jgi:hypothetical protein
MNRNRSQNKSQPNASSQSSILNSLFSKKTAFAFIILLIVATTLAHRKWKTTPESTFSHYKTSNLDVAYIPGTPVARNIQTITAELEQNLKQAEQLLNLKLQSPLKAYIYNTFEEKGAHVRGIQLAHAEPKKNTIYCIWNQQFNGLAERIEFSVLMYEKFGESFNEQWARAATAALADRWNHKTLRDWERFLLKRKLIPTKLDEPMLSDFIAIPYSASIAKEILDTDGIEALGKLYKTGDLPAQYQDKNRESNVIQAANYRKPFVPVFQKGMTYAYWNSADAGYAARKSKESLRLLKNAGVEWIAAIPYGYMRNHDETFVHMAGHSIGSESDESMFQLAIDAQQLGMKIMLKPQIWISHEAWPGKIKMNNEADWAEWFESYEHWIVHYAVIAELMHADLFCIGTELVETTLQHPGRWREIIAKVRQVYSGPIVYAANWGKEFEEITFWDALDYIGLDNYYPVRKSVQDGVQVIQNGFALQKEKLSAIAHRWRKPILFTEIGYMANEGAGMGWQEYQFSKYDEKSQADCYRAALETYWNEPWFAGMYWWKWFSNPDDAGRKADDHSPHGRPAEKVITEWYSKPR